MAHLLPCPGCARHVRATESACPFCAATITASPAPRLPSTRLGRAKTFAFGAVVATTSIVGGCSSSTTPGEDAGPRVDAQVIDSGGGEVDSGGGGTDSGTPGDDSGTPTDAGTPVDSGHDEPDATIVPPYGAPPADSGQVDAGETVMPLYGGPPGD